MFEKCNRLFYQNPNNQGRSEHCDAGTHPEKEYYDFLMDLQRTILILIKKFRKSTKLLTVLTVCQWNETDILGKFSGIVQKKMNKFYTLIHLSDLAGHIHIYFTS